jgi:hypothetical protein
VVLDELLEELLVAVSGSEPPEPVSSSATVTDPLHASAAEIAAKHTSLDIVPPSPRVTADKIGAIASPSARLCVHRALWWVVDGQRDQPCQLGVGTG